MAKYTEAQNKSTQRYISKAYDQIAVRAPKGKRDQYKKVAEERGKSLNQLIVEYLDYIMMEESKMIEALRALYDELGIEFTLRDVDKDYLTENTCRNGRKVLWYMDENKCVAIYIDTLEFLTDEEIEKELC